LPRPSTWCSPISTWSNRTCSTFLAVVDPELDAIKIYRRVEGAFARVAELAAEAGDTLTTPLLPGFAVSLPAVFASPI
jgi:hypothetical protein